MKWPILISQPLCLWREQALIMTNTLLVLLGGALGAVGRYGIATFVQRQSDGLFPIGTLTVNAIGSLASGVVCQILEQSDANAGLRLFLIVGLLGGFTTFSAFSMETFNLIRDGALRLALLNILLSNVICIGMAVVGYLLARWLS
jgi:CrcB protein